MAITKYTKVTSVGVNECNYTTLSTVFLGSSNGRWRTFHWGNQGKPSFEWPRISRPPNQILRRNSTGRNLLSSDTRRWSLPLLQFAVPLLRAKNCSPQISPQRGDQSSPFWYCTIGLDEQKKTWNLSVLPFGVWLCVPYNFYQNIFAILRIDYSKNWTPRDIDIYSLISEKIGPAVRGSSAREPKFLESGKADHRRTAIVR